VEADPLRLKGHCLKPDLDALYNAIEAESDSAYGEDDGELTQERANAIDRYLGRNTMPAPDGRSQVVDRAVYETIQWIQPSLARIFANGDDVVELAPQGPEDEQGAKQESQYLNFVALQRNNWPQIFDVGSKDALLTKAGYLYAYRKNRRQIEVERYERQTPEALALILQDKPEVLSHKAYPDESAPQMVQDPATGQPVQAPPQMLYDVELRRVKEEPEFCIEALPPERCKVSRQCKDVQVKDSPYFEYFDYPTLSELRQDGIDVPDDVEAGDDPDETPEDAARNRFGETDSDPKDPAMRRTLTRWVWIRYDADGDGIAELQYCIVVGKKVVHREEVNCIPIGVLCPDPLPHRHVGLCPADTVSDLQDISTAVMRGGLDNLQFSNNVRMFADPSMVNLDDVLTNRPGGVVRGKPGAVFGQHIAPIPMPFVFPQAMEALAFIQQRKEGRTGVNQYFQGTDQNAMNKTMGGVQMLSTMAAQRVEQIARMYAPGIVTLFAVLHEIILKSGKFSDRIKLNGQWVTIDPSQWRKRNDFRISVGYAAGNKDSLAMRLTNLAQMQSQALQAGLPIVNPRNVYETMIELTKAGDLSNPERFWTDPSTVQQPPQKNPQVEVEEVKGQIVLQKAQMDNQTSESIAQTQAMIDKYKTDTDAQVKLTLAQHQAESQAVMLDAKARHDQTMEGQKLQSTAQLEQLRSSLDPKARTAVAAEKGTDVLSKVQQEVRGIGEATSKLADMVLELGQMVTAPRKLIRDKDGRPVGSEVSR
jgi:hypothetical protein